MIRINLLPQGERISTSPVKIILTGISALVCVVLLALYGYGVYCQMSIEKQMQDVRERERVLEPVREQMEAANNKQAAIKKKSNILDALTKERKPWYTIVAHFSTVTPQNVWLKEFSFTDKETRIKGGAASYSDIAMFLKQMEADTLITEPVIDKAEKAQGLNSFNFEILVKVKGVQ
ncbi:MAG: PilN domain-containing protein [Pelosinus sp.]|nr:PilN domain-containing protein [Pelosinus sp.]